MPYDLTRGGQLYQFRGKANINQFAAFLQDSITLGELTLNLGVRFDRYDGLTDGRRPAAARSILLPVQADQDCDSRWLQPHHGDAYQ